MKAPWILIWALASVPVFAQGPYATDDRGQAFDLILDFVEEARAEELQGSRDAVDALRDELIALRDLDEPDEDAIASVREDLIAARRDLSDEIRAEIGANEDLQAELRSLAQEAPPETDSGLRPARPAGPCAGCPRGYGAGPAW